MKREELFLTLEDIDERYVEEAMAPEKKGLPLSFVRRPLAAVLAAVLLAGAGAAAYGAEMERRYNAAVGYLRSLGIETQDLSDYSHAEVRKAARWFQASEPAPANDSALYMALYEKVCGHAGTPPARPTAPAAVTADQVRALTPAMTLAEVTAQLGDTVDVGSGICILLYEVDGDYTLLIPFAGPDAQLGVTGETLLQALQPKE